MKISGRTVKTHIYKEFLSTASMALYLGRGAVSNGSSGSMSVSIWGVGGVSLAAELPFGNWDIWSMFGGPLSESALLTSPSSFSSKSKTCESTQSLIGCVRTGCLGFGPDLFFGRFSTIDTHRPFPVIWYPKLYIPWKGRHAENECRSFLQVIVENTLHRLLTGILICDTTKKDTHVLRWP